MRCSPHISLMAAISRRPAGAATWTLVLGLGAAFGCGRRQPAPAPEAAPGPTAPRGMPLNKFSVLETSGPPPPDTSVTFTTGSPRVIVLYHGGENISFARLTFAAAAFGDSGRTVEGKAQPRPGIYGLALNTSLPLRGGEAAVTFEYTRYFSASARAR